MNRNQHNYVAHGLNMVQTLLQPHSAVNDNNINMLGNRAGGPSHQQRMMNVNRVFEQTRKNNSLMAPQGTGAAFIRNEAPNIPAVFGGGNWVSSGLYGGLLGALTGILTMSMKKSSNAKKIRLATFALGSLGVGYVLKQPGQGVPHIPSIFGAGAGFVIASNLLGINVDVASPLRKVLKPLEVRAGR